MKNLILVFTILLAFTSCQTSKYLLTTNFIDYSAICNNYDFFITESNSVSFEYKPLGSISVECVSGRINTEEDGSKYDGTFSLGKYKLTSIEDAYKELFNMAVGRGANGVINLQSRYISAYSIGHTTYESRWIVTGMLIKR